MSGYVVYFDHVLFDCSPESWSKFFFAISDIVFFYSYIFILFTSKKKFFKLFWQQFGSIIKAFQKNFGIILRAVFNPILGKFESLLGALRSNLGSFMEHFESILGAFLEYFDLFLKNKKYVHGWVEGSGGWESCFKDYWPQSKYSSLVREWNGGWIVESKTLFQGLRDAVKHFLQI